VTVLLPVLAAVTITGGIELAKRLDTSTFRASYNSC
jgi:hypothetical protein